MRETARYVDSERVGSPRPDRPFSYNRFLRFESGRALAIFKTVRRGETA